MTAKPTSGLKIALPGYDAQTAPDYDLSFSSNWPMLQVVKTFTHTITSTDLATYDPAFATSPVAAITFTHNLGYYAFADIWQYSPDSRFTNVVAERLNSRLYYQMYFGKNSIKVPILVQQASIITLLPVGTVISVKVYTFDFTKAFGYAAITPPVGPSTYDPHIGIKIVRQGRDINSRDLRDYIFHSKGSAPQILTVLTPQNTNFVPSTTYTNVEVNYQIPRGIPARLDFLFSTDNADWGATQGGIYEPSTGLAYYTNASSYYVSSLSPETTFATNVTFSMTNTGLFTALALLKTVPFSVIVRRDPLLYSAPTKITT